MKEKKNNSLPAKRTEQTSLEGLFIAKSNEYMALHKDMSAVQRNVLNAILTKIKRNKDNGFIEFHLKEITSLMNLEGTHYQQFREAFKQLREVTFETSDAKGITLGSLIYEATMLTDTMAVKFKLTPMAMRFFVELDEKTPYTKQRVKSSFWSSVYTHELWDMLSVIKTKTHKNITISYDDLRQRFKMEKGMYSQFTDFKKRVLDLAKKEINEKTGITMDYEPIKIGRTVMSIKFMILKVDNREVYEPAIVLHEDYDLNTPQDANDILLSLQREFKLDDITAQAISVEYPFKLYANFITMYHQKTGESPGGFELPEKFLIEDLERVRKLREYASRPKYPGKKPKKTPVKKT